MHLLDARHFGEFVPIRPLRLRCYPEGAQTLVLVSSNYGQGDRSRTAPNMSSPSVKCISNAMPLPWGIKEDYLRLHMSVLGLVIGTVKALVMIIVL